MSYDLQLWSVRPFDSIALPSPEQRQHPVKTQWVREGRGWQISIFESSKLLPEDVPDEIAQILPGIQYLTEMHLEGNRPDEAIRLLRSASTKIAKAIHGIVMDPQEDSIRTPSGVKRFVPPGKRDTFSVLRLSWWFLESPLLSPSGRETFLALLERFLPEAMPRRYGRHEPPQHVYAETGRTHVLQFLDENAHKMVVWYPHRPVTSFHLGHPERVGASRLGFRTNILHIEIESSVLTQPGWSGNLRLFWRQASHTLNPIYGEVRTLRGRHRRGGTVFVTAQDSPEVTKSWWWRGVPKQLGCAVVLGEVYQKIWPEFLPHATLEKGLTFGELPEWSLQEDLSEKTGSPPHQIAQPSSVGIGPIQKYPEAWPFGEPFDPPKQQSGESLLRKVRGLFTSIVLVTMFISLPCLWAQERNAQTIYTLRPTPKTVAWGYYDAKAAPVLRIKSGDTVEIQTLITNSPKRLEEAGLPPDQVEQSLRDITDQVKDKGPGGHILTGPVYIEGAEIGDVLEVKILAIKLAIPYAYNAFGPGRGFLPDDYPYSKIKIIPLDEKRMVAKFGPGIEIPLHPFFGSMGDAPPESVGKWNSGPPWIMAGNLDNKDLVAGTTLYIPVHAPGALFEVGDGHAGQGDGEVDITALETSLIGTFQFVVRKDMHLKWPRAETPTHYITMGLNDDLNACATLAVREMIDFLVTEKHLSRDDAFMLASVAADLHITELVDGNKGVHMMIPKAIFVNPSK